MDAIFVSLLPAGHHLFSILIYILFFPPVSTIFMPSLCCSVEHQYLQRGAFTCIQYLFMSGTLVFVTTTQGTPLIAWLWQPVGLMLMGPAGL